MTHRHDHRRATIASGLVLGAAAFLAPHVFDLGTIREHGLLDGPTYGRRLLLTGFGLFVAVLVTGMVGRMRDWRAATFWTWLGSIAGVVLLLVFLGPGVQWPLTIGLGALYAVIPIAAAGLTGVAVHRLSEREPPEPIVGASPRFDLPGGPAAGRPDDPDTEEAS